MASTAPSLAPLLLAVALVCANGPFLMTTVLPVIPRDAESKHVGEICHCIGRVREIPQSIEDSSS